jgi:hypothetical protein
VSNSRITNLLKAGAKVTAGILVVGGTGLLTYTECCLLLALAGSENKIFPSIKDPDSITAMVACAETAWVLGGTIACGSYLSFRFFQSAYDDFQKFSNTEEQEYQFQHTP